MLFCYCFPVSCCFTSERAFPLFVKFQANFLSRNLTLFLFGAISGFRWSFPEDPGTNFFLKKTISNSLYLEINWQKIKNFQTNWNFDKMKHSLFSKHLFVDQECDISYCFALYLIEMYRLVSCHLNEPSLDNLIPTGWLHVAVTQMCLFKLLL